MKLSGNKILITGGASGIGLALAQRFIEKDNQVIVCGRRGSALKEAKDKLPSLVTKQCDLSIAEEREKLFQWVSKEHAELNVLINNAGIQNWMTISDSNFFQKAKDEININVETPVHLCTLFSSLSSITTIVNVTSG